MTRPPWWRPFARRRWDRAFATARKIRISGLAAGCVPEFRLVFATGIDRDRAFKAMGADRRDGEFEIVWGGR